MSESAISVKTREIYEHGVRRNRYLVSIRSDVFTVDAEPESAICSMQISEADAFALAKDLLGSLPDAKWEELQKWMKENSF